MEEIFIKEEPLFFSDDPALSEKSGDGEKGGDSSPPVGADLIKKEEPQESCVGEWVPIPSSLPTHDEKFSIKEEPEIKDDELDLHSEPLTPESSSFKADQVEDVSSTEKSSGKESEATYFGSSYLTCPTSQSKSLSNVGSPKADGKCSSRMDDLKLIELVRAHKCLYDAKNKHYKDAQVRDNVWKEISDEMKQPQGECMNKWRNLRSNFTRERRRLNTKPSGSANTETKKWVYYDVLEFLMPHVTPRQPSSNVHTPLDEDTCYETEGVPEDSTPVAVYKSDNLSPNATSIDNETCVDQSTVTIPLMPKKPSVTKKRSRDTSDQLDMLILELKQLRRQACSHDVNDPDRLFLLSLLPMMKQLSPMDNIDVKIEMYEALRRRMFKPACSTPSYY